MPGSHAGAEAARGRAEGAQAAPASGVTFAARLEALAQRLSVLSDGLPVPVPLERGKTPHLWGGLRRAPEATASLQAAKAALRGA